MNREHWKKMLPIVEAYARGETVELQHGGGWIPISEPGHYFDSDPVFYRIAKPKERVPLEAEDWIKDGPWWVKGSGQKDCYMVVGCDPERVHWMDKWGKNCSYGLVSAVHDLQRRNAASDWMPCWKEKE